MNLPETVFFSVELAPAIGQALASDPDLFIVSTWCWFAPVLCILLIFIYIFLLLVHSVCLHLFSVFS